MHFDTGDTAWVLASSALVLFMTPGLAFFYGGMVRAKNVLGVLMQSYVVIAVVSLVWVFLAYSLAFGPDAGGAGIIGTLHFAGLAHMGEAVPGYSGASAQSIPPLVFVIFQMMFAVITPALITGATVDRLKFGAFVAFVVLWSVLVYAPVAHWVFSPTGWLARRGAEDFAGGTVVHINAGMAGLAVAAVVGRRRGWPREPMRPHNVPLVLLGAGILWFGWFGFNAGSALAANQLSAQAFVNTNTAAAAAMLAWTAVEKLRGGRSTTLGAASGAVAGLVAITPACGFVDVVGALVVGVAAGAVCALAVSLKFRARLDDSLDVGGVHFVGGVVGALLIGVFGTHAVNGANGLVYGGGAALLGHQALAVAAVSAYSFGASFLIAKAIDKVVGLRVGEEAELAGLDLSQHAESGYDLGLALSRGMATLSGSALGMPAAHSPNRVSRNSSGMRRDPVPTSRAAPSPGPPPPAARRS
ncbi:MAG: ammonium transporter [Acidimicrobiales bacterium]